MWESFPGAIGAFAKLSRSFGETRLKWDLLSVISSPLRARNETQNLTQKLQTDTFATLSRRAFLQPLSPHSFAGFRAPCF